MEINDSKWGWCPLCKVPFYPLECCGNTTCNGGGCEKCDELWAEAVRRIRAGIHPSIEELKARKSK